MKHIGYYTLLAVVLFALVGCGRIQEQPKPPSADLSKLCSTDLEAFLAAMQKQHLYALSKTDGDMMPIYDKSPSGEFAFILFTSENFAKDYAKTLTKGEPVEWQPMPTAIGVLADFDIETHQLILNPSSPHEKRPSKDEMLMIIEAAKQQRQANN